MQQRQPRLGDILDDYCPRERRLTNHAVVAMIDGDVKQTRCTTCDAEHEYKHARVPRQRSANQRTMHRPFLAVFLICAFVLDLLVSCLNRRIGVDHRLERHHQIHGGVKALAHVVAHVGHWSVHVDLCVFFVRHSLRRSRRDLCVERRR